MILLQQRFLREGSLIMLLHPAEMYIELMQMLQQHVKRRALGHLGEGVHVLGEPFAAIAKLAIGTWHIGVRVVDIAREQHVRVHFAPVGTHLLAVFIVYYLEQLVIDTRLGSEYANPIIIHRIKHFIPGPNGACASNNELIRNTQ